VAPEPCLEKKGTQAMTFNYAFRIGLLFAACGLFFALGCARGSQENNASNMIAADSERLDQLMSSDISPAERIRIIHKAEEHNRDEDRNLLENFVSLYRKNDAVYLEAVHSLGKIGDARSAEVIESALQAGAVNGNGSWHGKVLSVAATAVQACKDRGAE
jgi:hypothetical protein